jgi:YVTN family beta-propeller protein
VSRRSRHVVVLALCGIVLGVAAPAEAGGAEPPEGAATWRAEREGIRVEAKIAPLEEQPAGARFQEARPVTVQFAVSDTTSGRTLSGLYPAAWMDRVPAAAAADTSPAESCKKKVESFLGGGLLAEPEVNLNVYYVLALNDDATITVVDPLFGFGGTKLLALIRLPSPGEDWALTADGRRLYVSLPGSDQVAVVDTATWKLTALVDVGSRPVELALQGDERYLWVAAEGSGSSEGAHVGSGVTVVDTKTLEVATHLPTGAGPHHLAFSDDDRWALVTDGRERVVTVVDVRDLAIERRVALPGRPVAIDWSTAARRAYLSVDGAEGAWAVAVDPVRDEPTAVIPLEAEGVGRLRFAPGGRHAFVVNPRHDLVEIVDTASDRVIQTADVLRGPDQVTFSDELAYVRHAGSELVFMIPLDAIGTPGEAVPVIDFSGGHLPPGESTVPSPADAIVQAPGATAVLVANPADQVIYYYKEGMAAPMGSFKNYGRQARAVAVVDRSLHEIEPGVYETAVQLRRPGTYDLALYLDAPPQVHCFRFEVGENPALERRRAAGTVDVRLLESSNRIATDAPVTVRFQVLDPTTGQPVERLEDLTALTFLAPGIWQERQRARPVPDAEAPGTYEIVFTPPDEGLYYVFFESPSVGMALNRSPSFILESAP